MNAKRLAIVALVGAAVFMTAAPDTSGPLTPDGRLRRPADLKQYVFLSSGYGMAYGPARDKAEGEPPFTNVFVNREGYEGFMKTGTWPDGSAFFLEVRRGAAHVSIDSMGRSQGGALALEGAVKDSRRFPDGGWAYFDFGNPMAFAESAPPEPRSASCYGCHSRHGAVQWSFTQFYPEQFAVAQRKGTVRKDYDANLKAE